MTVIACKCRNRIRLIGALPLFDRINLMLPLELITSAFGQKRTLDWMSTDAKMLLGATACGSPVRTMVICTRRTPDDVG